MLMKRKAESNNVTESKKQDTASHTSAPIHASFDKLLTSEQREQALERKFCTASSVSHGFLTVSTFDTPVAPTIQKTLEETSAYKDIMLTIRAAENAPHLRSAYVKHIYSHLRPYAHYLA